MADDFSRAMREPPPFSNSRDPKADRLGARTEAGELNPEQGATDRIGQERGEGTAASGPEMAGKDAELLQAGGPGNRLGGPHATDRTTEPGASRTGRSSGRNRTHGGEALDEGSLVDRLDP